MLISADRCGVIQLWHAPRYLNEFRLLETFSTVSVVAIEWMFPKTLVLPFSFSNSFSPPLSYLLCVLASFLAPKIPTIKRGK